MTDTLYLSIGCPDDNGRMLVVISKGHPTFTPGQAVVVLDVETFHDAEEAKRWFERMIIEQPWETRQ